MFARVLIAVPLEGDFTYSVPEGMDIEVGRRVIVPFGRRQATGFVIALEEEHRTDYVVKPVTRLVDRQPTFNSELVELAYFVSRMYLCSPGIALSSMIPSGRRETSSALFESETSFSPIEHIAPQQERALETIRSGCGMYYLYGVTGSGKSEVFLRAAEDVIAGGRQVIYLVPEITLTHQLSQEVMARFRSRVAILHSALTPSQRLKEWLRIMHHEVDLVIGARSAVFAPCASLGLIIMDEEHENSYKSGQTPRYHARQVAQKRCEMNGISFIMGSATPSLEAWSMMERGLVRRIDMRQRVAGGKRPAIEVVSMAGCQKSISARLEDEMRRTLMNDRSVILFLNRRGYSYYYHCLSCGAVVECPHCSVAMTYHKKTGLLHCHYCGYTRQPVDICPSCGSTDLSVAGHGTEKVEEEVSRLFPRARIARLDTDVASCDREAVRQTITDFREGRIDILLGTQMVAKGLNFPRLALVGVVNADSTLSVPDFRGEERTYSLLEQVAGRAGRYDDSGKVIIQTFRPADNAIRAVLENDPETFYRCELDVRRTLGFPPYTRLLSLVIRSGSRAKSEEGAGALAGLIGRIIEASGLAGSCTVVGVTPCLIEKKANSWRWQILLSSQKIALLSALVRRALSMFREPPGSHIEIDVDPLSLM